MLVCLLNMEKAPNISCRERAKPAIAPLIDSHSTIYKHDHTYFVQQLSAFLKPEKLSSQENKVMVSISQAYIKTKPDTTSKA